MRRFKACVDVGPERPYLFCSIPHGSGRLLPYVEYSFAPKHTAGEQLLDVRRDKREREAFAALGGQDTDDEEEEEGDESDQDMDGRYLVEMAEVGGAEGEPGKGKT